MSAASNWPGQWWRSSRSVRGVPAGLRRDTDLMETCARWLEAVCGGLPVAAITAELCTTIRRQGSLDHELANL